MPLERLGIGDDGGGGRRQFVLAGNRIRLVRQEFAVDADDLVFVSLPDGKARNEQLPDAAFATQPHRVAATVPDVEVANHRHAAGVGRPDRETHTRHAAHFGDHGAQRVGQDPDVVLRQAGRRPSRRGAAQRNRDPPLHGCRSATRREGDRGPDRPAQRPPTGRLLRAGSQRACGHRPRSARWRGRWA